MHVVKQALLQPELTKIQVAGVSLSDNFVVVTACGDCLPVDFPELIVSGDYKITPAAIIHFERENPAGRVQQCKMENIRSALRLVR